VRCATCHQRPSAARQIEGGDDEEAQVFAHHLSSSRPWRWLHRRPPWAAASLGAQQQPAAAFSCNRRWLP
jgi:hypothetical protein